jgi:hypothetical protein
LFHSVHVSPHFVVFYSIITWKQSINVHRWADKFCLHCNIFIYNKLTTLHNYYSNKMHTFIIKSTRYYNLYFFVLYSAPTCFNPRGSSSGGSMPVPG